MVLKGEIALFACPFVPEGWAKCDGKNGTPNLPAFVYDKNADPIPYCIATVDQDIYLLSMILPVAFHFVPEGWAACDGQLLLVKDYNFIRSILGSTYGGDGGKTFGLPKIANQVTESGSQIRYIINTENGVFPSRS